MTNLKTTPYWDLFADVLALFGQLLPVENSDDYWQNAIAAAQSLSRHYSATPWNQFCADLLNAIVDECARIAQEQEAP